MPRSEAELLVALALIPADTVLVTGEEFLAIGQLLKETADHIRFLRVEIDMLEAWRYGE